jgi:signal peptidase I
MADEKPTSPDAPAGQPTPAGAVTAEPMKMPPIPLDPAAAKKTSSPPAPGTPKKPAEAKDTVREVLETIVFVVVLVLMLKTFLAEAFVIPTGSMADTLLGYHYKVRCDECGRENLVNASTEAEAVDPRNMPLITRTRCQNCGHIIIMRRQPPLKGAAP